MVKLNKNGRQKEIINSESLERLRNLLKFYPEESSYSDDKEVSDLIDPKKSTMMNILE